MFHNTSVTLYFKFSNGFYAHGMAFMLVYGSFYARSLLRYDHNSIHATSVDGFYALQMFAFMPAVWLLCSGVIAFMLEC
jgi:site-specific recombinase